MTVKLKRFPKKGGTMIMSMSKEGEKDTCALIQWGVLNFTCSEEWDGTTRRIHCWEVCHHTPMKPLNTEGFKDVIKVLDHIEAKFQYVPNQ